MVLVAWFALNQSLRLSFDLICQAFDASLSVVLMKSQLEALESKTGVQVREIHVEVEMYDALLPPPWAPPPFPLTPPPLLYGTSDAQSRPPGQRPVGDADRVDGAGGHRLLCGARHVGGVVCLAQVRRGCAIVRTCELCLNIGLSISTVSMEISYIFYV